MAKQENYPAFTMSEFALKYNLTKSKVTRYLNNFETVQSEFSVKKKIVDSPKTQAFLKTMEFIKPGRKRKET